MSLAQSFLAVATDVSDEISPMMAALLLTWLAFLCCLVVAGLLLILVMIGVLVGGLATGIFSVSLLVWLKTKSVATGAKMFWLLMAGVLGLPIGTIGFWLLSRLLDFSLALGPVLVLGGVGGAAAGVVTAWFVWWAGRQALVYANRTLQLT